jgi:site-specific DNA-methyltransferase (adenine-specific)
MKDKISIGDATFYLGDCLEIMPKIEEKCIDLIVTSPPYDNLRAYEGQESFSFTKFKHVAVEMHGLLKKGGVIVWVVGDATIEGSETGTSFKQALYFMDIGLNLHDTMIWQKKGVGACGSNLTYWQSFEYMFIISKGRPKSLNLIEDIKNKSYGKITRSERRKKDGEFKSIRKRPPAKFFSRRGNVWNNYIVGGDSRSDKDLKEHPAIFPKNLAIDHVVSWSNEGDMVLDCFMGSGTTAIACYKTKRKFIGIEKEKKYFDIAIARYKKEIAQLRICDLPISE